MPMLTTANIITVNEKLFKAGEPWKATANEAKNNVSARPASTAYTEKLRTIYINTKIAAAMSPLLNIGELLN
jgi:hypothetical protein